jgi:hypothetical protein
MDYEPFLTHDEYNKYTKIKLPDISRVNLNIVKKIVNREESKIIFTEYRAKIQSISVAGTGEGFVRVYVRNIVSYDALTPKLDQHELVLTEPDIKRWNTNLRMHKLFKFPRKVILAKKCNENTLYTLVLQ